MGMRVTCSLVSILVILGVASTTWAQRVEDMDLTVTANNLGLFECNTSVASFDFGDVNADGDDFGTPSVVAQGRAPADNGGLYENAPGSVQFTCVAAPESVVQIVLTSDATDHSGNMAVDDLEVRLPNVPGHGGTSTDYQLFSSQALLLSDLNVGNGPLAATGDVDLRLTVLDIDQTGANTWLVHMQATGTP